MHELSIAMSLVDAAAEELVRLGPGARIRVVYVRIGALTAVVPEALSFSFDLAARGTTIEGACLKIESVPVVVHCDACRDTQRLDSAQILQCPRCGAPTPTVCRGKELELIALEVMDDDSDRRGQAGGPEEE